MNDLKVELIINILPVIMFTEFSKQPSVGSFIISFWSSSIGISIIIL